MTFKLSGVVPVLHFSKIIRWSTIIFEVLALDFVNLRITHFNSSLYAKARDREKKQHERNQWKLRDLLDLTD